MRDKVIIAIAVIAVVVVAGVLIARMDVSVPQDNGEEANLMEEKVALAEEWIRSFSPTYLFDGYDLKFIDGSEVEEGVFQLVFEFTSSAAGYGDRSDEILAQVITSHVTVITIKQGEVVSAITDGIFSEKEGEMIEEQTTLKDVYFVFVENGVESVVPLQREMYDTEEIGHAVLLELLRGPSEQEKEEGYSTAINEGVDLLSLIIEDGTAYADFSSQLNVSGGSALVTAIREQITNTLSQFETVDFVIISIEGETEEILQP